MESDYKAAQDQLRAWLVELLGPGLKGLSGFGVRWNRAVNGPALDVYTQQPSVANKVRASLPDKIDDLPVVVSSRGAAKAR